MGKWRGVLIPCIFMVLPATTSAAGYVPKDSVAVVREGDQLSLLELPAHTRTKFGSSTFYSFYWTRWITGEAVMDMREPLPKSGATELRASIVYRVDPREIAELHRDHPPAPGTPVDKLFRMRPAAALVDGALGEVVRAQAPRLANAIGERRKTAVDAAMAAMIEALETRLDAATARPRFALKELRLEHGMITYSFTNPKLPELPSEQGTVAAPRSLAKPLEPSPELAALSGFIAVAIFGGGLLMCWRVLRGPFQHEPEAPR